MCFFRKRREKKKALQEEQLRMQQEAMKKQEAVQEKPKAAPVAKDLKTEPSAETKEKAAPKTEETEAEKKNKKYHVSQNKDKKSKFFKQWRVRKEGSAKTIKYFETQAEAIDFAQDLANKNDTSIVIHKLDGSIRKQEY